MKQLTLNSVNSAKKLHIIIFAVLEVHFLALLTKYTYISHFYSNFFPLYKPTTSHFKLEVLIWEFLFKKPFQVKYKNV